MALPEIIKDIEARVKDTGDTMTGNLDIIYNWPSLGLIDSSGKTAILQVNPTENNLFMGMNTDATAGGIIVGPNTLQYYANNEYYNILHSGNKNLITPEDIGAFRYLGANLITNTTDDTTAKWSEIDSGYVWYSIASQLNNQPTTYGTLINFHPIGSEITQIWKSHASGAMYIRSGNAGGWGESWRKIYDSENKPTLAEIGALSVNGTAVRAIADENGKNIANTYRPLRRNICGQTTGTATNPWYKFASVVMNVANEDRTITFKVSQGFNDSTKMSGILTAHIRTGSPVAFNNAQLVWEYANDSIVTSDWVLAYLSTSGTDCKVELWCKQDAAWAQYHFEVLSCHDRTGWKDDWVLYNTQSAGSASAPTSGYTQIISKYGVLRASAVYGAVWNDYAEYRIYKDSDKIPYGRVIIENGDDSLSLSTERMQLGGNICSDTFGFAIGETDNAKLPIAVSGRVLAYTNEPRDTYKPGEALCSGPNGTVSKMTREEIKEYPDAIIGYVSAIPNYETWGTGNVKVDGRIWVKIK